MTVKELIASKDLEKTLIIGYYGGGNYGDELLLEILQNLLTQKGVKQLVIAYQEPDKFEKLHKNFGYKPFAIHSIGQLLSNTFKSNNIIIGGGGLWGVDINATTFALGPYLFFCRHILRKNVYLLGVGYYSSTTKVGHISAWFAAKGASWIVGRDDETIRNFGRYTKKLSRDKDIAWNAMDIAQEAYQPELKQLEKQLSVKEPTVLITLRRFRHKNGYAKAVKELLLGGKRRNYQFIVMALEKQSADEESYTLLGELQLARPDIQYFDGQTNPLALYFFFAKHANDLRLIGPQFHIMLTAYLNGVTFCPVVYDNKVQELFKEVNIAEGATININDVSRAQLETFLHDF